MRDDTKNGCVADYCNRGLTVIYYFKSPSNLYSTILFCQDGRQVLFIYLFIYLCIYLFIYVFCVDVNLNDRTERGQYPCSHLDRKRTYYMARKTTFSCGNTEGNPGKLRNQTPSRLSLRFLVFHISCCIIPQLIQNYSKVNENGEQQTKVSDDRFRYGLLKRLNNLRKANFRCDTRCYVTATCYLLPAITSKLCFAASLK